MKVQKSTMNIIQIYFGESIVMILHCIFSNKTNIIGAGFYKLVFLTFSF